MNPETKQDKRTFKWGIAVNGKLVERFGMHDTEGQAESHYNSMYPNIKVITTEHEGHPVHSKWVTA